MIQIIDRDYVLTHGRKPRGFGAWAFRLPSGEIVWETGTLTEAKAAIRRKIVGTSSYVVEVLG